MVNNSCPIINKVNTEKLVIEKSLFLEFPKQELTKYNALNQLVHILLVCINNNTTLRTL